jgi:hypothetical protein
MTNKGGMILIAIASVFAVAIGIGDAINPTPPDPPASSKPAPAPQQVAQAPVTKQWNTMLDGNKITCGITEGEKWFIIFPDDDQRAAGERPMVDRDPSDAAWQTNCGTGAIEGSW